LAKIAEKTVLIEKERTALPLKEKKKRGTSSRKSGKLRCGQKSLIDLGKKEVSTWGPGSVQKRKLISLRKRGEETPGGGEKINPIHRISKKQNLLVLKERRRKRTPTLEKKRLEENGIPGKG